jgi:5'-nucleotidase/UDP-sugar diphosphatase
MLKKRLFLSIAAISLTFVIAACAGIAPPSGPVKHLAIMDTSDLHSTIFPYEAQVTKDGKKVTVVVGGLDRISGLAKRVKGSSDGALLVSGGDNLMGFLFRSFDGVPEIKGMDMAGYDITTLGNHDFDLGAEPARKAYLNADFPIVCSNITTTDNELAALMSRSIIMETAGVKIGFFGLMTPDLPRVSDVGTAVTVDDDLSSVAIEMVRELREKGADLVVALTHVGKDLDEATAREVAGIDIIVGGHSHDTFSETVEGPGGWKTIIIQAGVNAKEAGVLSFDVAGGRVVNHTWETVLLDESIPRDEAVTAFLAPYEEKLKKLMGRPVGETRVGLDATNEGVRSRESNLGDFAADAWADWFVQKGLKDPIVLINGGVLRGNRVYPPGTITYGTLMDIHPYSNTIYEVKLTGKELANVLEMSASAIRVEGDGCLDTERVAEGGFLQVGGVRFTIDLSGRPFCGEYDGRKVKRIIFPGERVTKIEVREGGAWVKLDPNKVYTILTTSWTASGGDGYSPFLTAEKKDTTVDPVDALFNYIKKKSPIAPEVEGRIVIEEK